MINLTFVLRLLKGRCYGNQLIWDFSQTTKLLWRSETECNVAIYIRALTPAMMQLHHVKIW